MSYIVKHLDEASQILQELDFDSIERMTDILVETRESGGRLFILGVGSSAANASHAVNDFRKICGMEAYAPTNNVSELTARTNDEGWESVFVEWLKGSRLSLNDCVLVFSVGGGNKENNISANLVHALVYAKEQQTKIIGIVGRDGSNTAELADACCIIPVVNPLNITPHTEAFHAVVWHAMVSHPKLKISDTKWESVN